MQWLDLESFMLDEFVNSPDPTPTGFETLDRITGGGLRPGIHVLTAPPGVGKTSLAVQLMACQIMADIPAAYISIELGAAEIALRLASCVTGKFRWGDSQMWARNLKDGLPATGNGVIMGLTDMMQSHGPAIWITGPMTDYAGPRTIEEIDEAIKDATQKHSVRLVILDYLQLMDAGNIEHETDRIRAVSDALSLIAVRNGVPVLALAAQSREGMKTQGLTSVAGSSRIEYSALTLMTLCKDEETIIDNKTVAPYKLMVHKNRYGSTALGDDAISLRCIASQCRWWEAHGADE